MKDMSHKIARSNEIYGHHQRIPSKEFHSGKRQIPSVGIDCQCDNSSWHKNAKKDNERKLLCDVFHSYPLISLPALKPCKFISIFSLAYQETGFGIVFNCCAEYG